MSDLVTDDNPQDAPYLKAANLIHEAITGYGFDCGAQDEKGRDPLCFSIAVDLLDAGLLKE